VSWLLPLEGETRVANLDINIRDKRKKVAPDTVAVGFCHNSDVAAGFATSLFGLLAFENKFHQGRLRQLIPTYSSVNVSSSRNQMIHDFLDGDCEWLLTIDADMIFKADDLHKLFTSAHRDTHPIVGGLCFGVDNGMLFPTLYGMIQREDGSLETIRYLDFPENELLPVVGTGAAFLLAHRSVFTRIADQGFSQAFPWYQERELAGELCSEDMTFCIRAGQLGIPVFVNTAVTIDHQKTYVLTADMYRDQREWQKENQ